MKFISCCNPSFQKLLFCWMVSEKSSKLRHTVGQILFKSSLLFIFSTSPYQYSLLNLNHPCPFWFRAIFTWVSKVIRIWFYITTFNDWFCNRDSLTQVSRASRRLHVHVLFQIWLVHWIVCLLCDWPEWLPWYWFFDTRLKTALLFYFIFFLVFSTSVNYFNVSLDLKVTCSLQNVQCMHTMSSCTWLQNVSRLLQRYGQIYITNMLVCFVSEYYHQQTNQDSDTQLFSMQLKMQNKAMNCAFLTIIKQNELQP